ncbi:unnamed protein product, partial [Brugia timori]|uniref:FYR C-terminal domain-containing protein n=1 Tax=Brugia timori TaxID=42155 RepID=A0A0R3QPQ8_9BILA
LPPEPTKYRIDSRITYSLDDIHFKKHSHKSFRCEVRKLCSSEESVIMQRKRGGSLHDILNDVMLNVSGEQFGISI